MPSPTVQRMLAAAAALLAVAGCSTQAPTMPDGISVQTAAGLKTRPDLVVLVDDAASQPPVVPLLEPDTALAVYIPAHVDEDRDMLIGDHWVYFRLRSARWNVRGAKRNDDEPRPPVTTATQGRIDVEALRAGLGGDHPRYGRFLVPYRIDPTASQDPPSATEVKGDDR